MAEAEDLLVRIDATTERLRRELRRADQITDQTTTRMDRSLRRVDQGFDRLNRAARRVSGAMAALGLAASAEGLRRVTTNALSAAESIQDVSAQTGIAAERLQGLRRAFDQTGGSADQMDAALQRFNRRIGLAAQDSGAAADAVERLGIRVTDASGNLRDTGAVFDDVVTAISGLESSAERAAVASRFFGEEAGPALAPLLARGVDALDVYTERLRQAGTLMSDDLAQAGAQASATFRRVSDDIGTAFQIGLLEGFADETGELADQLERLVPVARDAGEAVGTLIDFIVDNQQEIAAAAGAFAGLRLGGIISNSLQLRGSLGRLIPLVTAAAGGKTGYQPQPQRQPAPQETPYREAA